MSSHREHLLQVVSNLREIADWIEANADLPMRLQFHNDQISLVVDSLDDLNAAARRLGSFEKNPSSMSLSDWYFGLRRGPLKNTDPIALDIVIDKSRCCKKVTRLRPVEEYECPVSILSDGNEGMATQAAESIDATGGAA